MSKKEEDFTLIKDFVAGNKKAFDALVIKHQDLVFNLCLRILGCVEEAEDVTQDVFIKAFKALNKFKFKSSFPTWLYRIAVNTCKNKLSSNKYKQNIKNRPLENSNFDGNSYELPIKTESDSPYENLNEKETEKIILDTINSLPNTQKILVVLRDIEEKSYDEIAKITGLKLGTVKSKLCRARESLKIKLKGVL